MTAQEPMSPIRITQRKPKIVHFYQDNHNFGGIQVYLNNTLPRIAERGNYEIVYVGTENSRLSEQLANAGLKTRGINFPLKKRSLIKSFLTKPMSRSLDLRVYFQLADILKQEQPDILHVHGGRAELAIVKKLTMAPMLYTYHGYGTVFNVEMASSWFHKRYNECMRPLFQQLIPHLDGMSIVSQYEKERLYREKYIPAHFEPRVVYNGIPLENFTRSASEHEEEKRKTRQELGIPENSIVVSFFCRMNRNKNPMAFFRIMQRLVQDLNRLVPVYFLVAGDGPVSGMFEEAFCETGSLAGHGQFLGFRNDVPVLLRASDISVSTSLQEGFGLRVLESLAAGTPCVAFSSGGVPEVMNFPNASEWLAEPRDEEGLYQALFRAVHLDAKTRYELSETLKQSAQTFSIDRQIDQLEQWYGEQLQLAPVTAIKPPVVDERYCAVSS